MAAHKFNAYLQYIDDQSGNPQTYRMWVMEYSQPHILSGSDSQAKLYKHFYPRSYSPGDVAVQGRVPTQQDYNNLAEFIRKHHLVLMRSPGQSNISGTSQLRLMRFCIPTENFYVEGIIKTFRAGAKRFAVAPEFQLNFTVVKDAHSKNADMVPSGALRAFWTGAFIDQGQTIDQTAIDDFHHRGDYLTTGDIGANNTVDPFGNIVPGG